MAITKHYFTFGQAHRHEIGETVFDKDCVVEIQAADSIDARMMMVEQFGQKWAFQHSEEKPPDMSFYRRGIIRLEDALAAEDEEDPNAEHERNYNRDIANSLKRY